MKLHTVWNGGSGEDTGVIEALTTPVDTDDTEISKSSLVRDLPPQSLVEVFDQLSEDDADGDTLYYDDESGRVWTYLEGGTIIKAEFESSLLRLDMSSGKSFSGVVTAEYTTWAESGDTVEIVKDDGSELTVTGEITGVWEE